LLGILGCWLLLSAAGWPLGAALLALSSPDHPDRLLDRLILAEWVGLTALASALLAVSAVVPLTPAVGGAVASLLIIASLMPSATRAELLRLVRRAEGRTIAAWLLLAIALAVLVAQPVDVYDTGLYHFQAVRWLSRFGWPPGLALIHTRFGYPSSWFALAAPFNAGPLESRIAAMLGGYVALLAESQLALVLFRARADEARREDWFIGAFHLLALPMLVWIKIPYSLSPNFPVIVLTGTVAWAMMSLCAGAVGAPNARGGTLPCVALSAGACAMKITAVPLLAASILLHARLTGHKERDRRLAVALLLAGTLVAPQVAAAVLASGCPFYPSSIGCLQVTWAVGAKTAQVEASMIRLWALTAGEDPKTFGAGGLLFHWMRTERVCVVLLVASLAIGARIVAAHCREPGDEWLLLLASLGLALWLYGGPSLLFGLGFLALLPARAIGTASERLRRLRAGAPRIAPSARWLGEMVGLLGLLCLSFGFPGVALSVRYALLALFATAIVALGPAPAEAGIVLGAKAAANPLVVALFLFALIIVGPAISEPALGLVLPPPLRKPSALVSSPLDGFVLSIPAGGPQCWAAELPCAPALPKFGVRLRDPAGGLERGFERGPDP
jgi:hypothetical protein